MHRLLEQLSDLENDREELGEEEYAEMRQDTLEQVFSSGKKFKKICTCVIWKVLSVCIVFKSAGSPTDI